jgi:hypothetical protein
MGYRSEKAEKEKKKKNHSLLFPSITQTLKSM